MRRMVQTARQMDERIKRMITIIVSVIIIGIFAAIAVTCAQASREQAPKAYRYYTCYYVEAGDTLWSIALEYYKEEYDGSIKNLVREIKDLNQMESDQINAGSYVNVPYYSTEEKW